MIENCFNSYICKLKKIHIILIRKENDESRHHKSFYQKLGLEKGMYRQQLGLLWKSKNFLEIGGNVYLRGFGSFIIKTRAEGKTGTETFQNYNYIKFPCTMSSS